MLALILSLVLTVLLLALPGMTWSAYKTRRGREDHQNGKVFFRLLVGSTIAAWGAHIIHYMVLAGAEGLIEVRHAIQLSTPVGWLVWLAALTGLVAYIILMLKLRRGSS
jgi:hypothetical protein